MEGNCRDCQFDRSFGRKVQLVFAESIQNSCGSNARVCGTHGTNWKSKRAKITITIMAIICTLTASIVAMGDGSIVGEVPKPQREAQAFVSIEFGLIWTAENKMLW